MNYRSNTNSPIAFNYYNNSPNLNSNSLHNSQANSSDGETSSIKSKIKQQDKKQGKKRSNSKKSRSNSANSSDEDTASIHSKDGNLNNSISWFKNPITRAFKKKNNNRSKNGSNQELEKTGDQIDNKLANDCKKHPQHPSQLHHLQDLFKNELTSELVELKSQLTDERLKSLAKEDELMKLKECFTHLQTELFSLRNQTNP